MRSLFPCFPLKEKKSVINWLLRTAKLCIMWFEPGLYFLLLTSAHVFWDYVWHHEISLRVALEEEVVPSSEMWKEAQSDFFFFFYQQPNLAPFGILLDTTSNHTFLKKKISICFLSWLSAETSRPLASSSLSPFFFYSNVCTILSREKKQTFQTIRVFVTIV